MTTRSSIRNRASEAAGSSYDYPNARIGGMRSRLLSRQFMDELADSKDIADVIQKISGTDYGPDLEMRLLHGRGATQVDEALRDNMVRTFRTVYGFSNDRARPQLDALLGRWDVFNIKTVIRGKHLHIAPEEIVEGTIPVGRLSELDVMTLAGQPDIAAVVDTLATWGLSYAHALRVALPAYVASGQLTPLELALDRHYHAWAAEELGSRGVDAEEARAFLGTQADITNVMTALRLVGIPADAFDPGELFLSGGIRITRDTFREITSSSDVDGILEALKVLPCGRVLDEVAIKYIEHGSISVFERALEEALFRRAQVAGRHDGLGFGMTLAFLWAKANEVTNLRIIVKGLTVGMPPERMREELIHA